MIRKNIPALTRVRASSWRKISVGSWRPTGDSSIHAELSLDVAELDHWCRSRGTRLFPVLCRAIALGIESNPEFNRVIRFGMIYQRRRVDLFILSSTHAPETDDDLSGFLVRSAEGGSLDRFLSEFKRARECLTGGDSDIQRSKRLFGFLPGWISRTLLDCSAFFHYQLNLWSPLSGLPQDAFGSVQITNVGSMGIDFSYSPIAPYTRISMVISVGSVDDVPEIRGEQLHNRRQVRLGFVVDHRVADGRQIARLFDRLRSLVANPGTLLDNDEIRGKSACADPQASPSPLPSRLPCS